MFLSLANSYGIWTELVGSDENGTCSICVRRKRGGVKRYENTALTPIGIN
jgi:hypothetical protein